MTEYALSYAYTRWHRYDSDLDERVGAALATLVAGEGGDVTGDGGGCAVGADEDALAADQSFYFTAPDAAAAGRVADALRPLLAFFDDRYAPTVRATTP